MTTQQHGEGSTAAASSHHRIDQYKRTPLSTPQGAQERRRQAALDERRRRRDASYSAARGLDGVGVGGLALPGLSDEEEDGAGEAESGASQGKKRTKKKKSKAKKTAAGAESFANVLQQAELLDTLPEDLDDDWLAVPWIPRGRRVLARVDWDPRYREDRLTLYSRKRGEPIHPASSGNRAMPATVQEGAAHDGEGEPHESSMAQDAPSSPSTASADLGLPTSFAPGPSTTTTTTTSSSSQYQQQQQKPRPRRRGGRSSHHPHAPSSYSFPLPLPLPRHTELDCVFTPRSAVLWVLDVRRWGHHSTIPSSLSTVADLRDHDAEFRLYWLSARLQEMEPPFLPAHFPANDVPAGGGGGVEGGAAMLDATGPFPYPFIIKALPVVPAPIGKTVEEWKRKVIDVATAPYPPALCKTAKVRRLVTAPPATPMSVRGDEEEGMDVDTAATPAAQLVTAEALLFPSAPPPSLTPQDLTSTTTTPATPSSDGILLLHREAGYVSGEEKTPLAAWVPTTCAAAEEDGGSGSGMDVTRFGRLLEEREMMRTSTETAGGDGEVRDDGEMET